MAASTSSAVDSNNCFDVFINHRGPDVKKTFASHLYRRLISYGLRVFLDYQEMQEGEDLNRQIQGAIKTASVHVAIFTPNYAKSKWCLDELVLMLESEAPIIPVFHNVKPADLRRTQGEGVYAESLRNLEKKRPHESQPRYTSDTIEKWRNALSRVADISGLELEKFDGDEGALLDKVVEVVMKKCVKPHLNVARYPTGLDEMVADFETKLSLQQYSGRVQVVGITGLGGAGKTTLAKELFNRKSSNYSKSYFLFDVRENAKSSLLSLQSKLVKGLLQWDMHIDNIHLGIEILRKYLSSYHIFLVLDDVDDVDQVDALLPVDALHPGSLILITCRDKSVLRRLRLQESSLYSLTGLNRQHSIELFCSHAFGHPYPLLGFEYVVDKILRVCSGLPLSLKVCGEILYGNTNKSHWEAHLDRLQKILPYDIEKSLQISYDALQMEEKEVFLDIACFFIGEKRDTATRIWDASGWNGGLWFQSLLNKSLVEVDITNKIRMHNHMRDLGRNLARDSRLPRRLWRGVEDNNELLQQSSVRTEVRGLRLLRSEYKEDADFSWSKMRRLQLLDIDLEGGLLERILSSVQSPNLIWLRWHKCPYSALPSWIPMNNLRVLEVWGDELETLWEGESQAPLELRELHIFSPLLSIPKSIGKLKHLEEFVVNYHMMPGLDLKKLPDEFCHLWSLKALVLRRCSEMKSLPESFGRLRNLQHIDLSECHSLEMLPDSFGNLRNLQRIDLSECHSLEMLPYSFGNLRNLQHIDLSECHSLKMLPDSFGNLRNLQHIDLSECHSLERLPETFGCLVKLKYLDLNSCCKLTLSSETLGNISTLEYIDLSDCSKLELLPLQVVHQRSLKKLTVSGTNLKELPNAIVELSDLEVLILGSPVLDALPPSLGELKNLRDFMLDGCKKLNCLPDSVVWLNQLTRLRVRDCPLSELPFIRVKGVTKTLTESGRQNILSNVDFSINKGKLQRLQNLELYHTEISEVSFSEGVCSNLQHLLIHSSNRLVEVETLPNALIQLELSYCSNLGKIGGLSGLSKLQKLNIEGCSKVEELPGMETLVSLKEFDASECVKLKSIQGLAQVTQLRELNVSGCSELEDLPDLEHLRRLEVLKACNCVKLKSIQYLAQVQLPELHVYDWSEELPGTETLVSLKGLGASQYVKQECTQGLAQLTQLREIDVFGCSELKELPGIEHLRSLEVLRASGCLKLKNIQGLEQLTQLRELDVSYCYELEELPGVEDLWSLDELQASNCVKLKSIQGLAPLTKLRILNVSECYNMETLEGVEHLKSLEKLNFSGCPKLRWGWGVVDYPNLQLLRLHSRNTLVEVGTLPNTLIILRLNCPNSLKIKGLETLVSLEELDVSRCVKLKSIRGLALLTKLRILKMSDCSELEELPDVEHLMSLERVYASGCHKLKSIRGWEKLTKLRELDVCECSELEALPGVENCMSLETLHAFGCPKLQWGGGVVEQLRERVILTIQ